MTDAEKVLGELLDGLAARACDLMERECAVECGRDHHAVLVLLAAGNALLSGLEHPDAHGATAYLLPMLCERVAAEARRRADQADPTKN